MSPVTGTLGSDIDNALNSGPGQFGGNGQTLRELLPIRITVACQVLGQQNPCFLLAFLSLWRDPMPQLGEGCQLWLIWYAKNSQ